MKLLDDTALSSMVCGVTAEGGVVGRLRLSWGVRTRLARLKKRVARALFDVGVRA